MKNKLIYFSLLAFLGIASFAQEKDKYGGFTDIKGEKTGFFHAEQINGRWWLVTPEGNAFYGIGMSHPITGFTQEAVTFTYGGDQEAWFKGTIQRMRDLGFNCVWSGPYCPERLQSNYVDKALAEKVMIEANIPHVFPIPIIKHFVELEEGEKRPDVFSESYIQFVRESVAKHAPKLKDNPWIMGYYFGFGSFDRESDWINETLERKDSPGREHLMEILEVNYKGDIEKLNNVYGTNFSSFKQLKRNGTLVFPGWIKQVKYGRNSIPETPEAKQIFRDGEDLLGEIVEQVHRLGYEAIRKYDKNHMVYGFYLKEATLSKEHWQRIAPYIDVLSPQHVSKAFPIEPMVKLLGKPAMISDQPLQQVYAPALLNSPKAHGPVPGHEDRLVLYNLLTQRIAKAPEYIGVDICSVMHDQSHANKAYELGQPGFFTITGEPKYHLNRAAKLLNHEMLETVQLPPNKQEAKELNEKYHKLMKVYKQVINERKDILKKIPPVVYQNE